MELYPIAIIAGGLATRLRPDYKNIPKSMIPISGEPFVKHQLQLLKKNGFENIIFCLGYMGEIIENFIKINNYFGMEKIRFSYDEENMSGTGYAVKHAMKLLDDNFFVIYGDSYLVTNYQKVQQKFVEKNKLALMTVYKNENKYGKSNVEFQNDQIISYDKINRTDKMQHIDFGCGVFNKKAFDRFSNKFDLYDVYKKMLQEKQLSAYTSNSRFYEVGSFQGIRELENYFIRNKNVHQ
jgi:N-acetyl-alpha-D-muramate 1-phosphate uridylyltransferase